LRTNGDYPPLTTVSSITLENFHASKTKAVVIVVLEEGEGRRKLIG
jgi:hypothetical protein